MASSGSITTNEVEGRSLTLSWTLSSQSVEKNTSTIAWELKGSGSASGWVMSGAFKAVINGVTVYSSDTRIELRTTTTVASGTATIAHNSDGTKSFSLSCEAGIYTYAVSATASGTHTLTTIPRASTISATNTDMGSASTITITRASSSFTHTLTYSFGSATGTIVTKTTGTSVSWTPALTLANQIPNAVSGKCTITCKTYSGTTEVGSKTCTVTLTVPASVKPTITSLTASRVDGTVPTTWGIYVQSKSKANLTINGAAGAYGSTISSYSITGGGYSSTASSFTTGFLNTSGSITFTASVTDSRGRVSANATVVISVVAYSAPSFSKYISQRCNSAGTASDSGTYVKSTVNFSYASCSSKNTITTATYYKKTADTTWTNANKTFTSGTAFTFGGGNVSAETSYAVKFTLTDAFTTIEVTDTLSTASVVMDFKSGGLGVAVGKVSETDKCLEVNNEWLTKTGAITAEGAIKPATHNGFNLGATTQQFGSIYGRYHRMYDNGQQYGHMSINTPGTADTLGDARIVLGNSVAQGTDKNARGLLYLYGQNTGYHCLVPTAGTSNITNYFPATTGYLATTGSTSAAVGGTAKPIYVTAAGVLTALSATAGGTTQPVYLNAGTLSAISSVAVAYGGTGATTAAAARTNLGISVTQLYTGTLTTGSTTFNYGSYNFYVIVGQPSSGSSRCTVIIPKSVITTSAVSYQFADESNYYSFNISYSGTTVTLAYKGRSGSGQILKVYGVN
ncbi:TPA: pilus assembly protein [Streptococcus equi subsp. zooepidemicus]|nr:pilus assembly protein [Streptococcus equi subsp. zooepidemicus]HEL1236297.1 pilus assembly protein [Streptococcus equi subsp. zooepidemicus]